MRKNQLLLLVFLLAGAYAHATNYYTASASATLAGNSAASANWTTNPDGITGVGNVTISPTDNLFILTGAKVVVNANTTITDLNPSGGTATELQVNANLTVQGNITGNYKRTGLATLFILGASSTLSFTEAAGSSTGTILLQFNTITLSGPTTTYASVWLYNNSNLNLNGYLLSAHKVICDATTFLTGGGTSAVSISTSTLSGGQSSTLYFDGTTPGSSNLLSSLSFSRSDGTNSAWLNINSDLEVGNLAVGPNSSTGYIAIQDYTTLTIDSNLTNNANTGIAALATGAGRNIVLGANATIVYPNEKSRPIQDGSNVTINGGTLVLNGLTRQPALGTVLTLLTGGNITGSFNSLQESPCSGSGTLNYPSNAVTLTVGQPPTFSYDNFDSSAIKCYWSTTSGSTMSLSTDHFKSGQQSLRWDANGSGGELTAAGLNIPSALTYTWQQNATRFYVYNKTASNDTLIVRFYDTSGVVKREGHMLLNFTGWQDYYRSLRFGYSGAVDAGGFALAKCKFIYRPQLPNSIPRTLFFDEVSFAGVNSAPSSVPGPYLIPDTSNFYGSYNTNPEPLNVWLLQPDVAVTTATAQELTDWQTVKTKYNHTLSNPSSTDLTNAKTFVTNLGITWNADSTIKGSTSILFPVAEADLLTYSQYVGTLARAYRVGNDADAGNKCIALIAYFLDQGIAEGRSIVIAPSNYTPAANFSTGFIDALPLLNSNLYSQVIRMLKWENLYGYLYGATFTPGYNVDNMLNKSTPLFNICFADTSTNESVRDLKMIKRFMERFTVPGQGTRDGFKIDGSSFHHQAIYPGYMYTLTQWIKQVANLSGTVYKIAKDGYDRMSFAIKSLTMPTSSGVAVYANTLSGRHPFPNGLYVRQGDIRSLIAVGADIIGQSVEPDLAAAYNYFFPADNAYPSVAPANYNGYYQYNYGQLGVLRNPNWVANLRGLTKQLWGTETYATANRFGRYQSYGALEFLYGNTLKQSGYLLNGDGWDWNAAPGTTSVQLSWASLNTVSDYANEYQKRSFAGALALGKHGIWAMDFEQYPIQNINYNFGDLKFKKSVFAFDSVFVCLGTGISTTNSQGKTVTNLFQNVYTTTDTMPQVFLNSVTGQTANYEGDISTGSGSVWLVNTVGTGYYIPQGNGNVHVIRGSQSSPTQDGNLTNLITAQVTKAWIDHGLAPANTKYQLVAVPGITPGQMQTLSGQFAAGNVYRIEKQTDTLHAVSYIPGKITGYAFFAAASNVGVGYVQSISGPALVGMKKDSTTLTINIDDPDLNTTSNAISGFISNPYNVSLVINGVWTVRSNPAGAVVATQNGATTISFVLQDGLAKSIQLDSAAVIAAPAAVVAAVANPILPDMTAAETFAIKVTQNPSFNHFLVRLESNRVNNRINLNVMDINGKMIDMRNNLLPNQTLTIGANYGPGVYIIKATQGMISKTAKLVKL